MFYPCCFFQSKVFVNRELGKYLAEGVEVDSLFSVAADALEQVVRHDCIFTVENQASVLQELVEMVRIHPLLHFLTFLD